MEIIKPGKYTAKIVDYGIGETKAGNPQAAVVFEFKDDQERKWSLSWFGHFTEKTIEKTLDALLVCGLHGNDVGAIASGPEGGALDMSRDVSITVEHETDDKGKTRAKVRWVNRVGGNSFKRMEQSQAVAKLGNLKGAVLARRQETGIQDDAEPGASDGESVGF